MPVSDSYIGLYRALIAQFSPAGAAFSSASTGQNRQHNFTSVLAGHERRALLLPPLTSATAHCSHDRQVGYSGAELANLLNEAAIVAVRREKNEVGMAELEIAMEKVKMGLPRPPLPLTAEKRKLAYVEAGRAVLVTVLSPICPDVLQVCCRALGVERPWGRGESQARPGPHESSQ